MAGPALRGAAPPALRARDNPFATHRLEALAYRLPGGTTWEGLLDRFEGLGRRAALVGPEGRGKTTLLEQLGVRLEGRGLRLRRVTLRRGERRPPREVERRLLEGAGPGDLLLVDGAQELGWWPWRRLERAARRAGGLLVTRHRPGRLPTLLRCETSPELLEDLVAELLGGRHRLPGDLPSELDRMYQRHGGDLRAALQELYDRWAGLAPSPP